jgi:putative hydrolase of the HAD superfamily
MTDTIDWLVFDLGGVLVDVAPSDTTIARLARRSDTPESDIAALMRERFTQTPFSLSERFQSGELDEAGFHAAVNAAVRRPLTFDALMAELEAMLLGEMPATLALLARLAPHHQIACYSNTNARHWRYIKQHFEFWRYLDRAFASQELGVAKPDRRGFELVAHALHCAPERCLLIDDRQINVDGARRAGWQALRFDSADALQRDLAQMDISSVPA